MNRFNFAVGWFGLDTQACIIDEMERFTFSAAKT